VALKGDGTVVAWGSNSSGQTTVPAGLNRVVAIAAGGDHTVALKGDGTVVAWGSNSSGQTTVPGGLSDVVAIAAGAYHTVALKSDGTVVAWGFYGQSAVPGGLGNVVAIAAGGDHTVALKDDGTVVAWGSNQYYDRFTGQSEVPAGLGNVVAIAAGGYYTVALKGDGTVVAWGDNGSGQTTVPAGLTGVVAIAAGGYQTVALKGDGTVMAWGSNSNGQTTVPAGLSDVVAIAAGRYHTVALKGDGTVVVWGNNVNGWMTVPAGLSGVVAIAAGEYQTVALKGDGTVVVWGIGQTTAPAGLTGVVAIAAGWYHTVALKGDGTVMAWGSNVNGQTTVPAGLSGVVAIAAGRYHTVALKGDGTVVAWGDNVNGQTTVPVGLNGVVALAAGEYQTVALKGDGTVVAWGSNSNGQTTVPAGLSGVVAIAAGESHTVALKGDGSVVAWGSNSYGLTNGLPASPVNYVSVPVTVAYDAGSRTATLTPDIALSPQSVYRATIFGNSAAGTPMARSSTWTFSTGESLTGYLVMLKAGPHGKIAPAIGQLAISGTTANFTLIPDVYYEIDTVTGGNGSLVGSTYTTGPVSQACTVMASFRLLPPAEAPTSLTVPTDDNDGSYTVGWVASPTAGVTYLLQEATDAAFTTNVRVAYSGTAISVPISGRLIGKTYYYRVLARKTGNSPSAWVTTDNGCLVTIPCEAPASIAVPVGDPDGSYTVSWGASATPGAYYVLQEATDAAFTTNVRVAYSGPALGSMINWRSSGMTYYYRIRSTKGGYIASDWRVAGNGCVVTQLVRPKVTVTSKSPAAAATWVPEHAPVTATFSEAMDPATITSDGFTLEKQVGVVAISKGQGHTLALKGDGTVAAWGSHFFGEATVPASLTDVVAVAAGVSHSVVLKGDGTVITWGVIQNDNYEIIPATVPVGLNRVVAIAAGYDYTVALKSDGTVVAWGYMYDGTAFVPVTVPAGLSGVKAIAAEGCQTVALKSDGTVAAWGYRYDGTAQAYVPATVPTGLSGVAAVAAGSNHAVALKGDGTVVAWGDNYSGQTTVPAGLSGVAAVAAGSNHTVVLKGDGTVVAWGDNSAGQTSVPAGLSGVAAIAAGLMDTVALKGDGTVVAWGNNDFGQLSVPSALSGVVGVAAGAGGYQTVALKGDGTVVAWNDGNPVPAGLSDVVAIAAGGYHVAALKGDGTVVAWGDIYEGTNAVPVTVPTGLSNVVAIAAGGAYRSGHTVALKGDGTVVAWGDNSSGQTTVPTGLTGVVAVAAGSNHTVALKGNGTVVAWGDNAFGQTTVPAGLSGVVAIAAGSDHTVALKGDGTVIAWGWNITGQTTVPADLSNVVAVAAGNSHTVALKSDGTVVAWGHIIDNCLDVPATVPAGLSGVVAIAAGGEYTIALKGDGTVVAWGDNMAGQTTVPTSPYFSPVPATVLYNGTSRTATLTPNDPLPLPSVYRATVFGRSANGTPMAGSHSWKFSTGEYFASFLVTPKAGMHGKITPAIGQLTIKGTTASFALTPDAGYAIDTVTGCGGSLVGNTYTTGPISQACTVTATFHLIPAAVPSSITVPTVDTDGSYTVTWGPSATAGVTYVLQEATSETFTTGLRQAYAGTGTSASITGRLSGKTYYYRVRAQKAGYTTSAYRTAGNDCAVTITCGAPASLTVPMADADGTFAITWATSITTGAAYEVQEATNSTFTANLRTAYTGTATTASITGRSQNLTYYYRIRATKAGYTPSTWRVGENSCAVPGSIQVAAPASIAVPVADNDGVYIVSWGASATSGVIYELQEATSSNFSTGLRSAYRGPLLTANITGLSQNVTYYYRVRAVKGGLKDSGYRTGDIGCRVGP
jgi:alpha-tubulin suppressor-like RCC1 family protein